MLLSSRVTTRVTFSVWSVSGYAHVFVLHVLSVVIVSLPKQTDTPTVAVSWHVGIAASASFEHIFGFAFTQASRVHVVGVELQLHVATVSPRRFQVLSLSQKTK